MFVDTTPATTEWVVEAYQNRHFELRGRFETEAEARECARRICGPKAVEVEPGHFEGPWGYTLQGVRSTQTYAVVRRVDI